jgi:hypothetical protein
MTLNVEDLMEIGVVQGHAKLLLRALFPVPVAIQPAAPLTPRLLFPELLPTHRARRRRQGRAARSFVSCLRQELPLRRASELGSSPSWSSFDNSWKRRRSLRFKSRHRTLLLWARSGSPVRRLRAARAGLCSTSWWAVIPVACLLSLLLTFPPDALQLSGALGVAQAALAFISRQVLVVTDEGAAVLQAWFNQPPPVTKKWMLGPILVQWLRTLEQLDACDNTQSSVSKRLSLFHLVSKIRELVPELASLRVAAGAAGIEIGKGLVDLVRAKGEAFNSEKQTPTCVSPALLMLSMPTRPRFRVDSGRWALAGGALAANGSTTGLEASLQQRRNCDLVHKRCTVDRCCGNQHRTALTVQYILVL